MLTSHYQEIKSNLKEKLVNSETIEEAVKVIQYEIRCFTSLDSDYIKKLTPPQARLALTMLKRLNESISIMLFVNLQKSEVIVSRKTNSQVALGEVISNNLPRNSIFNFRQFDIVSKLSALSSSNYYKRVLLQPLQKNLIIISSLFSAGFAGTLEGGLSWGLIGAIIGSLTGGVFSKVVQRKDLDEAESVNISSQIDTITNKSKLNIDIDKLLAYLHREFQSIDISVTAYSNKEDKSNKFGLENNLDLLEYIQDLMADTLDQENPLPINLQRKISQAHTILRRYGIEARVYQPNQKEDDDWSMFYFEPSLDPQLTEYVTLKHAFIKDEQVLLAGCVIEPASVSQSSS
ncbi:MAG: hypothetical protein ACFB02_20495 [Mastigocoleus sp.]